MKNYAKIGKRIGRPAFRTPATFRFRQYLKTAKLKCRTASKIQKSP